MLNLKKILLREIQLRMVEPFVIATGVQHLRRILLVEAVDQHGFSGWSECVAQEYPNYSPETVDTARHAIREWLAPIVLGRPLPGPEDVFSMLDASVRGHLMAKAAVEMACWALEAERRRVALTDLLGGSRTHVEVGISLGIHEDLARLIERVRECRGEGYRKIKLKIKRGADIEPLRKVRDALGPELPLAVDANASYSAADFRHLCSLDEFGLMMIEQPLEAGDLVRHASLQDAMKTAICLDESITSAARAEDMIHLGSGRIINIKPGRLGGHAQSVATHDLCAERNVPVWCGGMLESGIGRAHNVALASLSGFSLPGDLSPSRRYWERDIVEPEWTMSSDGRIEVPRTRPGLGVQIDLDRIDDLTQKMDALG